MTQSATKGPRTTEAGGPGQSGSGQQGRPARRARAAGTRRRRVPTVIQMESAECGAACVAMILGYYGKFVPLEELRTTCGVSRDGARASSVVAAARSYGLIAHGFQMDTEALATA